MQQASRLPSVHLMHDSEVNSIKRLDKDRGDEEFVIVIKTAGTECCRRCTYVVGADGPGSIISKFIGTSFDGFANLARPNNTVIRSPALMQQIGETIGLSHQLLVTRPGVGTAALVLCDAGRALFQCPMYFPYRKTQKPLSARELIRQLVGTSDFEIVQESHYYWNFFIATKFSKGHIFLVGDAAHSWPPLGGTGGNTAYADVNNLAWKLIHACRYKSSQCLLQSYDLERRQHDMKIGCWVLNQVRTAGKPERNVRFLASPMLKYTWYRKIMKNMFLLGTRGRRANQHFAQSGFLLGFRLFFSPIIAYAIGMPGDDAPSRYVPQVTPGGILPNFATTSGHTVYDAIDLVQYTILLIGSDSTTMSDDDVMVATTLQTEFEKRGLPAMTRSIALALPHTQESLRSIEVWREYTKQRILIVRPDLLVSWSSFAHSDLSPQVLNEAVDIITGLNDKGIDIWSSFLSSERCRQCISFMEYLRSTFARHVQPLKRDKFPNAVPVQDASKSAVVSRLQRNDKTFKATTKVSAPTKSLDA